MLVHFTIPLYWGTQPKNNQKTELLIGLGSVKYLQCWCVCILKLNSRGWNEALIPSFVFPCEWKNTWSPWILRDLSCHALVTIPKHKIDKKKHYEVKTYSELALIQEIGSSSNLPTPCSLIYKIEYFTDVSGIF